MKDIKIKICGLKCEEDIEYVNSVGADYAGFVFEETSSRFISEAEAKKLKQRLSPNIKAVGIFVNKPLEYILKLVESNIIDIIQLHGDEDEQYISDLKENTDKLIIKAFRINTQNELKKAENSSADYILLDSSTGGSGICIDWSIIYKLNRPFFLAGGLNSENVDTAINTVKPYAVDVSSGVETDLKKDFEKIKKFVKAARR